MATTWLTKLRRFFGFEESPAQRRLRRRAQVRAARADDGLLATGFDNLPDFDDASPIASSAAGACVANPASCSEVDTTSSVIDTNNSCSFDMNSAGSFDGGGGCGGGSSSE